MKEPEPVLLIYPINKNIDGSLVFICCMQTYTFSFLYYNFCLCKSFKEHGSKWSASEPYPYQRHGKASFATAKVHLSGKLTKYSCNFLANFEHLSKLYIIYNTREKGKKHDDTTASIEIMSGKVEDYLYSCFDARP